MPARSMEMFGNVNYGREYLRAVLPLQFLETFVLAFVALGIGVFVLVAVLPTLLPRAVRAASRQDRKFLEAVVEKLGEASDQAPPPVPPKALKGIRSDLEDLQIRHTDIRWVMVFGLSSALALLAGAFLGLYGLFLPPLVVDGIAYSPTTSIFDGLLGLLALLGIVFMVAFAGSFFRIAQLYVKGGLLERST